MKIFRYTLGFLFFLFFMAGASAYGYFLSLNGLIYKNVYVSGVDVGGLKTEDAEKKIAKAFDDSNSEVNFHNLNSEKIDRVTIASLSRDYRWAADQAFAVGRSGNFIQDLNSKSKLFFERRDLQIPVSVSDTEMEEITERIAEKTDKDPVWPKIEKINEKYELKKGEDGLQLDKEKLKLDVLSALSYPGSQSVTISVDKISTAENPERVNVALEILNSWEKKELTVRHKDYNKNLSEEEIVGLFGLTGDFIDHQKYEELVSVVIEKIETEPKDAVFEFEEGKVKEFLPEVVGVKVNIPKFYDDLSLAIQKKANSVEVATINEEPKIKTGDINNLGIKELIGVGRSRFVGSIPGRVFNVNLAASRINGVLVPPGEEFSFNKSVGGISRQTGYQTAYVISEGRTVLGDGGGVCQVSTTVFRAAMNSGFPITERKAHSYRVGYYEQDSPPGLDATIYSPSTDFKFLNDTGNHILVQTKVNTEEKTLVVEIYGTSDGRVATVSSPVISSQSRPPETAYIDDPTLPAGTLKQVDWSASGAKVSFDYKVEKNGAVLFERKFLSNYQPWRAVFLKGTGQ